MNENHIIVFQATPIDDELFSEMRARMPMVCNVDGCWESAQHGIRLVHVSPLGEIDAIVSFCTDHWATSGAEFIKVARSNHSFSLQLMTPEEAMRGAAALPGIRLICSINDCRIPSHLGLYAKKRTEGGIVSATLGLCTDHLKALSFPNT